MLYFVIALLLIGLLIILITSNTKVVKIPLKKQDFLLESSKWIERSCKASQFWNGTECKEKSHHNEFCEASFQCNQKQLLDCINKTCKTSIPMSPLLVIVCFFFKLTGNCHPTHSYYDFDTAKCKSKLNEGSLCSASYNCLGPMLCRNGKCQCESHEHFNEPLLQCLNKTTHETFCHSSSTCRDDIGLKCIENKCQCDPITQFWSNINEKCKSKLNEGSLCSASYNCLGPMLCRNGKCQCESHEHFNEPLLQCLNKTTHETFCHSSSTCRDDIGLICVNNKCQCDPITQLWSNINEKCENFFGYGKLGCSKDNDCRGNLVCNLKPSENNCSCPMLSLYGMCDCKVNENEQFYWNGETCTHALRAFSFCKFDYECKKSSICLQKISLCSSDFKFSSILRNDAMNYNKFHVLVFTFLIFIF
jgi:hypothetical protein